MVAGALQELEPLELKGKALKARNFRPMGVKQATRSKKAGKDQLQSRDDVRIVAVQDSIPYSQFRVACVGVCATQGHHGP